MKKIFNTWEGIYESFEEASRDVTGLGFNGDTWRTRTLTSAKECLEALRLGEPIPSFYKQRSTFLPPVVGMLLKDKTSLSILDLGGGLGIGYMSLAECIPSYSEKINYTIIEVPEICETGKKLFPKGEITYMDTLPTEGGYDLIHSASALQYIDDWQGLLRKFAILNAEYIFLSDVFTGNIPSFVTLQNYYGSKIPHWFLNFDELLLFISSLGYEMVMKSFVSSRRLDVEDILPMDNLPEENRLKQSVHLLFHRK
jgi:putative methyltransferase (TIGR04325 family)